MKKFFSNCMARGPLFVAQFLGLSLFVFTAFLSLVSQAEVKTEAAPRIYISVGDPNLKKVLLAIEPTAGGGKLAEDFQKTLQSNFTFTDLFEFLPTDKMPSRRGGMTPGSFDMEPYKALGVDFLLKSSITRKDGQPQAELRLYDVSRSAQIIGRLYPLVSPADDPARELAHFAANDVMKSLTGEEGIFRTRILMSCGSNQRKEIYIMDFDGQNVRRLTQDNHLALSPSWAPDGRRILFTSFNPPQKGGFRNPNLYLYDTVTKERRAISAQRGLNTGGVFHPTENLVAYTFSVESRPELYLLDLNNNTRRNITRTQFFTVEPDFSPDGTRLAYSSSQSGRPHVWVANMDGSSARRLTFAGYYNSSPRWSPRGDRIAFSGQESQKTNYNIFLVDPSGSNLGRLTDGTHSNENPTWSPDGRHIAFASNRHDGKNRIFVMSSIGTNIRPLSPLSVGQCQQPAWSPRL